MPRGKKAELATWIAQRCPPIVGEPEWDEILIALAPISESYLRRLLRESGVPLHPVIEGVRQETLESLETSLLHLHDEYEQSDKPRRDRIRHLVITAKEHARLAGKDPEYLLWLMTWLENPPLFPDWVRLRRHALEHNTTSAPPS